MGSCNIDHSVKDVIKKLEDQASYLPKDIYEQLDRYLQPNTSQEDLNEIFHLLKKYDLVEASDQAERNKKLQMFSK